MVEFFGMLVGTVRSVAAYVGVSLWILILAPPGMVVASVFRRPDLLYALGRGGVRLGLYAAGIRYRVAGVEHIQSDRGAVYCVNHSSNLEPPIVYMALSAIHPRLKILYKSELRRVFVVLRNAFDIVGFVPIERGNREQSSQAIDTVAAALISGDSFMIFPEGTRSRTGELLPFKRGGFVMAIKGQAPVVPVAIQGTSAAMRKGSPFIRPVRVSVRIGSPIEVVGLDLSQRNALIADTRAAIERLLGEGPVSRSIDDG